uniref:DNA recombination protein n=1 Tax=viral metagenome TaxID=1070528 RepID=A0A6H1ZQP9_9ZZZZ
MTEQSIRQDDNSLLPSKVEIAVPKNGNRSTTKFDNEFDVGEMLATAGKLSLTEKQQAILFKSIKDEDIEIRPDGLVYAPWMEYATRLNEAFGGKWALIPNGMPKMVNNYIYWGHWLIIDGHLMGYAIGEQAYIPSNYTMTYGDAMEGAWSNALMRNCKHIGISLELWKPSFVRAWKEKWAETYQHFNQKKNKTETLWRKKGSSEKQDEKENVQEDIGYTQQVEPEDKPAQPEKYKSHKSVYPATDKQKKMIFARLKGIGVISTEDMQNFALEKCGKTHSKDWTGEDIQTLVDAIERQTPDRQTGEGDS